MNKKEQTIFNLVRAELTDELIPQAYRRLVDSKFCGHCHHASLAIYNLLGGKEEGYKLQKAIDEKGITHYWVVSLNNEIIDPTVEQYTDLNRPVPYSNVTDNRASYRKTKATKLIIDHVQSKIDKNIEN